MVAELTTALDDKRYNICSLLQEKVYDFKIIYGDTDSLFVTNVKKDNDVMKFIAERSIN